MVERAIAICVIHNINHAAACRNDWLLLRLARAMTCPPKYHQMQLDIMGQKGTRQRAASGDELATSHGKQAQKNRLGLT